MYLVYLFKEKETGNIIYVGSSSRPSARMKEHMAAINGEKTVQNVHSYMIENGLKLYKDVEVIWYDIAESKEEMYKLEERTYRKFVKYGHLLNSFPGNNVKGENNPRRKGVINKSDGNVFKTVTQAANFYNVPRTTFTHYLSGLRKQPIINGKSQQFEYIK